MGRTGGCITVNPSTKATSGVPAESGSGQELEPLQIRSGIGVIAYAEPATYQRRGGRASLGISRGGMAALVQGIYGSGRWR
jgi:hypothetical protein